MHAKTIYKAKYKIEQWLNSNRDRDTAMSVNKNSTVLTINSYSTCHVLQKEKTWNLSVWGVKEKDNPDRWVRKESFVLYFPSSTQLIIYSWFSKLDIQIYIKRKYRKRRKKLWRQKMRYYNMKGILCKYSVNAMALQSMPVTYLNFFACIIKCISISNILNIRTL